MNTIVRPALVTFAVLTALTGIAYPLVVTGIGQVAFPDQAARVAKARNLPLPQVQQLIEKHTEGRLLGFLGEPRVNVLQLNLALDAARS